MEETPYLWDMNFGLNDDVNEIVSNLTTISSSCFHPSFMHNKCIECHKSKMECGDPATIRLGYINANFSLTLEAIRSRRDAHMRRLLSGKKLHLVLDLDHTLIHAREIKKLKLKKIESIKSVKDVFETSDGQFMVKIRPGAREFLKQLSSMFELSIYTMGTRHYAHQVLEKLVDSEMGTPISMFSWVITREDCLKEGQKNLDVVLAHRKTCLIVDDSEEVWEESCKKNLINIGRYHFFSSKEGRKKMDMELNRVFNMLTLVHHTYFDASFEFDNDTNDDYCTSDVREVLKLVTPSLVMNGGSQNLGVQKIEKSHQQDIRICRKRSRPEDICVQEKPCKKLVLKFQGVRVVLN